MKMAKTALYTISVRLSKETIQKLEKHQKEHHLKSRSECLQQAVERYLNPENQNENPTKTAILEAFQNPEIQNIIKELINQTLENTTVTLKKP